MKLYNLIITLAAIVGLTSCLNDGENTITTELTPYCFTLVTDAQTGQTTTVTGTVYKVSTDQQNGTITLSIEQLKLGEGRYVNISVANQKYNFTQDGATEVQLPFYISSKDNVTHTVTDYTFRYWSRYLGAQSFPLMQLSFNLDNQYNITTVFTPAYYWGTTTVTDEEGNTYTNSLQTSFYGIQFDPAKNTARLGLIGAKLAEAMPAQNMVFPDIPYTLNQSGYILKTDRLTPTISDTPYPAYQITDLQLSGTYGGQQRLQFNCTIDTPKTKGTYRVVATLNVMPQTTQQ